MEKRNKKFMLALSPSERATLQHLAEGDRTPAAAVIRRLLWREADERAAEELDAEELEVARKMRISPAEYLAGRGGR